MLAHIRGIGLISPQKTFEPDHFLEEVSSLETHFLRCIEPEYRQFIPPIQSRRMSRLIKMGISSAKICLADAGVEMPDAIITGTGWGSVEDTEEILSKLSVEEKFFNPTPFIQSTYNTISSQIAIFLKCHNYNSTYVHRSFSLESAILDGLMLLTEKQGENMLVCGIDEMTETHYGIIRRLGYYKDEKINNLDLLKNSSFGTIPGEGCACICLSADASKARYGTVTGLKMIYRPGDAEEIRSAIEQILSENHLTYSDIDLALTGMNGDPDTDGLYRQVFQDTPLTKQIAYYKHLCGEYYTSTGFALWLAGNILRHQHIPEIIKVKPFETGKIRNILFYNHQHSINHSLILVQKLG
ncbi:MAG: 3-oxoacyl-ACP synthase [Bacteroidetes bacterium]|nr:3-oxoacyl-ACP synthase [Bacteroidota bacterium]